MSFSMPKLILYTLLLGYVYAKSLCGNNNEGNVAGYRHYDNVGYYKLYTLPSTWGYAWKQCKEDGGHLVVIDSVEEQNIIMDMVNKTRISAFIGVHDMFVEGLFYTVKGDPFVPSSYNKWAKDQPNNYNNNQHCVFIDKSGQLWDGVCEDPYSFISLLHIMKFQAFGLLLCIAISVHGNNEGTHVGQQSFPGGYEYFPGVGYYKLYTEVISWNDAWKRCMDDGANLVVIESLQEYEIVRGMQGQAGGYWVYVGIHDLLHDGIYVTLTGGIFKPSEYLRWDKGEPSGNGHCVSLETNGQLNTIPCSNLNYFVCERKENLLSPQLH